MQVAGGVHLMVGHHWLLGREGDHAKGCAVSHLMFKKGRGRSLILKGFSFELCPQAIGINT